MDYEKEKIPMGVTVIDADTLLLKDEYCTFYLHRPSKLSMNWYEAMAHEGQGRQLPDRWQAMTIGRYKDEVCKHFDIESWGNWFWTRESNIYKRGCAYAILMNYWHIYYHGKRSRFSTTFMVSAFPLASIAMNWIKVAPGEIHKYPKNFLMRSYDGYTALITESSIFVIIKDNTGRIQEMSKEDFFSQPHAIKEYLPL